MWDVVIWQEGKGDAMDYLPTCWGNGQGEYKWPSSCSRALLETLINSCDPLIRYKYKMYKATTKKSQIKTLSAAQYYCQKGLETSNLESNFEKESDEDNEPSKTPIIICRQSNHFSVGTLLCVMIYNFCSEHPSYCYYDPSQLKNERTRFVF